MQRKQYLEVVPRERKSEEGGVDKKQKIVNERDSDGENNRERKREKKESNREATGRTERRVGQAAANLTFIICHHAILIQHLHSDTR